MRWSLILQDYDYTLEHRDNTRMRHADALSRCFDTVLVISDLPFETTLSIKQTQDKNIVQIRQRLEKENHKDFELRNGVVCRKEKDLLLFFVPSSMEHHIIRSCHDDLGHVGEAKCCEAIRRSYWFSRNT